MTEGPQGWGFPGQSRKAHFFQGGMALCRTWGFYSGPLQDDNHESPDNCAECKRQHAKLNRQVESPT